jgi:hypothetical protein
MVKGLMVTEASFESRPSAIPASGGRNNLGCLRHLMMVSTHAGTRIPETLDLSKENIIFLAAEHRLLVYKLNSQ